MDVAIFILSTCILGLGIINLSAVEDRWFFLGVLAVIIMLNALDVFIAGNQTTLRQVGYLGISMLVTAYSLVKKKNSV